MANIKVEKIDQFLGFGNDTPNLQEHYRSVGFAKGRYGATNNKSFVDMADSPSNPFNQNLNTLYQNIGSFSSAYGRDNGTGGGKSKMLIACDIGGYLYGSQQGVLAWKLIYPAGLNSSQFDGQASQAIILDQKDRLLYSGKTHIGMYDASISDVVANFSATNGSNTLTGTGFDNSGAWNNRLIRVFSAGFNSGNYYYVRINNVSSTTSMSIYGSWPYATNASSFGYVLVSFNDYWKSWGTTIGFDPATGDYYNTPAETYEDTVMWGRQNVVATLNTVTDTINASAFTLPTGFAITHIQNGANGVLIGGNFQGKGVLVLWDNYSDRSIAPWIRLNDSLISMTKDNGQWIVQTGKELYVTNGYTLTIEKRGFLDGALYPASVTKYHQKLLSNGGKLTGNFSGNAFLKGKLGVYQYDMTSKTFGYVPQARYDFMNTVLTAVYYDTISRRTYAGITVSGWGNVIAWLGENSQGDRSSFITEEVGQGDNVKVAQGLQLDLGFTDPYYTTTLPLTFTLVVKYSNLGRVLYNYGQLKVDMVEYDRMHVDETLFGVGTIGDEIEFLEGVNAGRTRNIINILNPNTNDATYIFDRALPAYSLANKNFSRTKFQLVRIKQFTSYPKMPTKDELFFNIKDNPRGKKFMFKVEILDANQPLELKPLQFIYDDTGTI